MPELGDHVPVLLTWLSYWNTFLDVEPKNETVLLSRSSVIIVALVCCLLVPAWH